MQVEESRDVKDYLVLETEKFRFKIVEEQLEKMKEKKGTFNVKIATKVMKQLRLTAKSATGQEWQDSVDAIIEEVKK